MRADGIDPSILWPNEMWGDRELSFGLRHNLGDAAKAPSCARPPHVVSTHQMLHAHGPKSGTDTTAQLNQAELARLQAGAPPMAPQMAPPPPPIQGGNSMGMPGPNTGPGLTPYSASAPPR